ncbi:MAG: histidine kinase [Acidobacteria bacterium]|nr:MAG: histidine kinase [Acidobacteriota bacterium]
MPAPHEEAARLAAIVQSSDDAIIGKDLNGIIASWNPAAERMFGYAAAEAIGQSIHIIIPKDRKDEEDDVIKQIKRGEKVDHFETIRCRKDGVCFPLSLTVSPIRNNAGAVVGASTIARDISERKRAEAEAEQTTRRLAFLSQLSAALATSLDHEKTLKAVTKLAVAHIADWCSVDMVREDGRIERLALAHVDRAKMDLAETVRDRYENPANPYSVSYVIRTGTPAMVPEITDAMIAAAAKGDEERIRLVRALGAVSYLCVPMIAAGRTIGALTLASSESGRRYTNDDVRFAEDVASRVAMAVENALAYQQVRRADRLKDEFLATLSHELRTPLNAILGYSRLLRGGLLPAEKVAPSLETIERNAMNLTQMVDDVLDVARIVSGKMRLHVQPVELPLVLQDAIATVMPAAEAKRLQIQTVIDPQIGTVSGDPARLQQVVWNLLSNAVKFTPKGGRIQLRLERINSSVEIVISDTGIGIHPDFLPYIFERFRQADSGTARQRGGLGLGLAIASNLVEMHGGTIRAASAGEGQGATFRVRLPLMAVQPAAPDEERRVHPLQERRASLTSLASLAGTHVLAVDDDPDARRLLQEILEAAGARVTTASSASAAFDAVRESRPDVLVADLGMPIVDGYELIKRLRQSGDAAVRAIPAAALTAYARSEDRAKALETGFELHLAKPIDPAELVAAIRALARRRSG